MNQIVIHATEVLIFLAYIVKEKVISLLCRVRHKSATRLMAEFIIYFIEKEESIMSKKVGFLKGSDGYR